MNRLLKKEIKLVPVKVLNMRYCRILERAETMDAKDIPVADANEILWIEDELRRRLIGYVGYDLYSPDRIKPEPGIKIKFRAIIKSSLGSKVAEVSVEADSKIKADILVRKEIRKLGLRGTTYKLS